MGLFASMQPTPIERAVWVADQLGLGSQLHLVAATTTAGRLSRDGFENAVRSTLARHRAVLDPGFSMEEGRLLVDRRATGGGDLSAAIAELAAEDLTPEVVDSFVRRPFPEGTVRFRFLLAGGADHTEVLAVCHHLVADQTTLDSLLATLVRSSTGEAAPGPPTAAHPTDTTGPALLPSDFNLADGSTALDQERPARIDLDLATTDHDRHIELVDLNRLGLSGDRVPRVSMAAWAAALHGWADRETIAFLSPFDRRRPWTGVPPWGLHTNDVLIHSLLTADDTVGDFLNRLAARFEDAAAMAAYPTGALIDAAGITRRDDGSSILTDYLFIQRPLTDLSGDRRPVDGDRPVPLPPPRTDLVLTVTERGSGLADFAWQWREGAASTEAAQAMQRFVNSFLEAAATRTDRRVRSLPLVTAEEADALLTAGRGPDRPIERRNIVEVIAEGHRPGATAVATGTGRLSYGQLLDAVHWCRDQLRDAGCEPDSVVAVRLDRNEDLVVALLAVLAEGAIYMPLDPSLPPGAVDSQLAVGRPQLLVTGLSPERWLVDIAERLGITVSELGDRPVSPHPAPRQAVRVRDDSGVYIMFTSGSTGVPKAARVNHAGFMNHLAEKAELIGLGADDTVAQLAPISFDIHVWQIVAALAVGGTTRLYGASELHDPLELGRSFDDVGVSVINPVPSLLERWCSLAESGTAGEAPVRSVRAVIVTGEAFPRPLAERLHRLFPNARLINGYGQSECSHDVSHHIVTGDERSALIPIGTAAANTRLCLVDRWMRLRPPDRPGELAVAGVAVGHGYLSGDTRPAFVDDPFGDGRLYLTGDICTQDGRSFLYHGRRDHQLKVGGRRVELGAIESACIAAIGVRHAAVSGIVESNRTRLVAFVEAAEDFDLGAMLRHLADQLPTPLVPDVVVIDDQLELSRNGKVDRRALKARAEAFLRAESSSTTGPDDAVADCWRNVLGVSALQPDDNFFSLGGDSLQAMEVIADLSRVGWSVSVRDLYLNPRLADFRAVLLGRSTNSG